MPFAVVPPLFENRTRMTNVMPPTYVPDPVLYSTSGIVTLACAWIATTRKFEPEVPLNARFEIASVAFHFAVIFADAWVGASASNVIKKLMEPVPPAVIEIELDELYVYFELIPPIEIPPRLLSGIYKPFAVVPPVLEKAIRMMNVIPPT